MRCLNLADGLRSNGGSTMFVCSVQDGHLGDLIERRGFPVALLPSRDPMSESTTCPEALPIGWRQDAEDTIAVVEDLPQEPDWLVVDHYSLDAPWEAALRSLVRRILVVDDFNNRQHDCDLFLNQNYAPTDSDGQSPQSTTNLRGPGFALLQPEYAALHEQVRLREGPVRRVLIFLGDAGASDVTGRALAAFLDLDREDIEADVVLALRSPHADRIRALAAGHRNVHVFQDLPTLAPLIARADLAIGAAGATSWERLCLGLPSVVIALAENQMAIAKGLHTRGLARWVGDSDGVTVDALRHELASIVANDLDASWSRKCHEAVDGRGVERVTEAMLADVGE